MKEGSYGQHHEAPKWPAPLVCRLAGAGDQAGTHPTLVQDRVGHSNIKLTMDVYGKLAGDMALAEDQAARLNALTAKALPALAQFTLNIW